MQNVYLTLKASVAFLLLLFCRVASAQPVITSFSPTAGPVGTTVTITGSGFSTTPGGNVVFFGADQAAVQSATATTLSVTVPTGATYSPVTVTTNKLTAYSRVPFVLTFANGDVAFNANSFMKKSDLPRTIQGLDVAIVDLNGDGRPEIIGSNTSIYPNTITVLRNATTPGNPPNFLPAGNFPTGTYPYGIATGDLDGDGKPDVAVANANLSSGSSVSVFRNSSIGDTIILDTTGIYATGNGTLKVFIADIDLDGKPDLVTNNSNTYTASIFRNTTTAIGNITFAPKVDIAVGTANPDLAVGDIDGDGKPDLAALNASNINNMAVLRNVSTPGIISFAPILNFSTVMSPLDIKMGDLNGDGKLDVVVTNFGGKNLSIFKNTSTSGNISFGARQDYSTGLHPKKISIGDLNGDGKPEISMVTDSPWVISVYRNTSVNDTIRIDTAVGYPTGYLAQSNNICDMDGDGKPDLVISNGSSFVAVIRNQQGELPTLIKSFTPTSGDKGTLVTIFGQHLANVYAVRFGGILADSVAVLSDTIVTAKVGAGATGNVSVITPYGTFSKAGFTFTGDTTSVPDTTVRKTPVITTFSPTSGRQGTTVTIFGQHFTGAYITKFGITKARSFAILSDTVITAIVDTGSTGDVIVATPYGVAHKAGFTFIRDTVPVCDTPRIISFNPVNAVKGTAVTIFGAHFNGATAVRFGGVLADSVILFSDTVIVAIVDTGATGAVSVTTPCGVATKPGFTFFPDSTGTPDSLITRMDVGKANASVPSKTFALYPNPASGYVIWQQPATNHITQVQIIDIYGRIMKTVTLGKNVVQTTIPVSGLPTGMYKLVWSEGKNKLTKSLLIK
jgi:hypothetical protein